MKCSPVTACLVALAPVLTPPVLAQDGRAAQTAPVPIVSIQDLELVHVPVRHVDPEDLAKLLRNTAGRQLFVKERGGLAGKPVENIQMLGDEIIVYDTKEHLEAVLTAFRALDKDPETEPLQTLEYTPRYVSEEALRQALEPLGRRISVPTDAGRRRSVQNIRFVSERGLAIITETEGELNKIRELLARLDVPQPQVSVTCYLVRSSDAAAPGTLPAELVSNLATLVPGEHFESLSFAMLRTSVALYHGVELRLVAGAGTDFLLSFTPVAYDRESGSLSVQECRLEIEQTVSLNSPPIRRVLFSTHAILHAGEYTVLGTTGADPTFLVVRLTSL